MSDLLFTLSKLAQILLEPDALLLLVLAVGVGLLYWRPRVGRIVVTGAGALLLAVSVLPVGAWLLAPLENRFPRPDLDAIGPIDGIVVLGGALRTDIADARNALSLNRYAERVVEMTMLARRFPKARLVYSGGSGDVRRVRITEAAALAPYLPALGLPPGRVLLEDQSRNTYENARDTRALVKPKAGSRWLLVTSSYHLPRAMGVFRAEGWDPIAYPVDYQTSGRERWPVLAPALHWRDLDLAAHEYVGLLAYYAAGYSNSVFPGPRKE
ncbi:MAG: YdcF family protein [Alphaproteobacteria bacterium]|nr:YdcF family protein [Alphaproteobacteria bacterium]MCB9928092.1 YdcF family protein [Alphaproteobacteria bacterium]